MTITTAAQEVIRDFLRRCEVPYPAICLGHVSDTPSQLTLAVERGASREEIREIAARVLATEQKYLYPLVYPRSHFLWLTSTIGGFRFAASIFHPPGARRALKHGLLDVAERGLVLRDLDGNVVLPSQATSAL
jgi:hypothetical protein